MGPVSYLAAKKEVASKVKLDKKENQTETTMKTSEALEPENTDKSKIESTSVKPLEKEAASASTENSDYFLSQNNQE